MDSIIKEILKPLTKTPYELGFDCGKYGANIENSNFKVFNTPESTKEWERGKTDGEREK
jgi:hypothetical protein